MRVPLIISGLAGMQANQIHHSLADVKDIVPTLLDIAQAPRPGPVYRGQAVEALAGRSLLPVLLNQTASVHPADEPIGFELSGNQALFKGNLKLVRNMPPVGDGAWHLYDLSTDPGETRDLQLLLPGAFKTMQADYVVYARTHGVLTMPEGYDPATQVLINSVFNYWLPTYLKPVLASLAAFVALLVWLARMRKRRKARA